MKPRPKGGYSDTYVETVVIPPMAVVVVRGEGWNETNFADLRTVLQPDVLLIHLPETETIEVLDEEQMAASGWVRVDPA